MIADLFLYFAQFPNKRGVRAMATFGKSQFEEYAQMLDAIDAIEGDGRVPKIDHYVYGQTFDELKQLVDTLTGCFLFADYGEFELADDGRRSYQCTQRLAVTVAMKHTDHADALERVIVSNRTLQLLTAVHAWMMADAERGRLTWLSRSSLEHAEIVPFVATELKASGWTLMLNATAPDALGTHALKRSFERQG